MTSPKVAAILCVRNSSTRLPNKPLVSYHPNGKSNLECIIDRVLTSRHNPRIVVATSNDRSDDTIANYITTRHTQIGSSGNDGSSVFLYRGELDNVVARFDGALKKFVPDAEFIWRVMGDCPLLDVGLNDWRTDVLQRTGADSILVNSPEPTYAAMGSVWSRAAWDYCAKNSSGSMLEHPGELIWERMSEFRILHDPGPESVYYQNIRTELDTEEDLEFFRQVWKEHYWDADFETRDSALLETKDVLTWLSSQPNIVAINSGVKEKTHSVYLHGHHRARRFVCKECGTAIGHRVNDKLSLTCPGCGEIRDYY